MALNPSAAEPQLRTTESQETEMLKTTKISTEHFTDLSKLNFPMVVWFQLEPIFNTAPAASKNDAQFKSGQNQLDNKQLTSLI